MTEDERRHFEIEETVARIGRALSRHLDTIEWVDVANELQRFSDRLRVQEPRPDAW